MPEFEHIPSVNVKLDSARPQERLESFFLTQKGVEIVEGAIASLSTGRKSGRVSTVAAPPGSGKSYLALFLGTLLRNAPDYTNIIDQTIERNPRIRTTFREVISSFRKSQDSLLPIYLVGDEGDMRTALLRSIFQTLERESPAQHDELLEHLRKTWEIRSKAAAKTVEALARPDDFFAAFDSILHWFNANTSFSGIAIFHDEFNRLLAREKAGLIAELDFLQDFAEYLVRLKKGKALLFLLTHKGISQYAEGISAEQNAEWLKIEGRFNQIAFQEDDADTYALAARFIERGVAGDLPSDLYDLVESHAGELARVNPASMADLGEQAKEILKAAAPLHPLAFLALSPLSIKFGQNERTLFSFISEHILGRSHQRCINLVDLFDYFDPLVETTTAADPAVQKWRYGRMAIGELQDGPLTELAKCLTVLSAIGSSRLLSSNAKTIAFGLGWSKKQTENALAKLQQSNLALHRMASDTFEIYFGSTIDVEARIDSLKDSYTLTELASVLRSEFPMPPVYARKYNSEYFTSRFYRRTFVFAEELERATDEPGLFGNRFQGNIHNSDSSGEGQIFFVIKSASRQPAFKGTGGTNQIFVVPRNLFEGLKPLRAIAATRDLLRDKTLIQKDPRVVSDLNLKLTEQKKQVSAELLRLFSPKSVALHGTISATRNSGDLGQIVDAEMYVRFPHTPKLNCELIVRDQITPTIRNARKKLLRSLIAGQFVQNLGFEGHGPEVSIFRSLFVATGLYQKSADEEYFFSSQAPHDFRGNADSGLYQVFQKIHAFLQKSEDTIAELYDVLTGEPYGLYTEVIPLLLFAALSEGKYSYSLYEQGRYIKEVNSDVVERLHQKPDAFKIRVIELDAIRARYLAALKSLFETKDRTTVIKVREHTRRQGEGDATNAMTDSLKSLLGWYANLPKYTVEHKGLPSTGRHLLGAIQSAASPEEFLFQDLPGLFGFKFNSEDAEIESNLDGFLNELKETRDTIESLYSSLLDSIIEFSYRSLTPFAPDQGPSGLRVLTQRFIEENQERIERIQSGDPYFRRLIDRFKIEYATDAALAESLGALLMGEHPRYWKTETKSEFETQLLQELSKLNSSLYVDRVLNNNAQIMERIRTDFRLLTPDERKKLLAELENDS